MPNIWLIGMMGAGKSAVGRRIAAHLELDFVDTDDAVAARAGASISELWDGHGEQAFRELERVEVAAIADRDDAVVATGGGVVLDGGNVAAMRRSGTVVWLDAPPGVLAARVADGCGRPLLAGDAGAGRLAGILAERLELYAAAAHVRVDASGDDPDRVAEEVVGLWTAS